MTDRLANINDPVERIIIKALLGTDGLIWTHESESSALTSGLDFRVVLSTGLPIYVECARAYTPRKIEQLGRASPLIYCQDLAAARIVGLGLQAIDLMHQGAG